MQQYIIKDTSSIRDALVALNNIAHDVLNLFIVDDDNNLMIKISEVIKAFKSHTISERAITYH